MNNRLIAIRAACLMFALTFFGACQPKGGGGDARPVGGPAVAPAVGTQPVRGTSDPGGGNGARGKTLEAYAKDLSELRGYDQFIKPVFQRWQEDTEASLFENIARAKTWYLGPIRLQPIDNQVLGFSFSRDGLQQLALQTGAEVVIDEELSRSADEKAFAALVWHEIVMSWYLQKFETLEELCRRMAAKPGLSSRCVPGHLETSKLMGLALAPQKRERLGETDYQRIRRVTDWVIRAGAQSSTDQLRQVLADNEFDPRFYRSSSGEAPEPFEFHTSDLLRVLRIAPGLSDESFTCLDEESLKATPCRLEVSALTSSAPFAIEARFQTGGQTKVFKGYLGESDRFSVTNNSTYNVCLQTDLRSFHLGDQLPRVCLVFSPRLNFEKAELAQRLVFQGAFVVPSTVSRVYEREDRGLQLETPLGTGNHLQCADLVGAKRSLIAVRDFTLASDVVVNAEILGVSEKECQPVKVMGQ